MQYETKTHKIHTGKQSTHSEMGPVWQNPIQKTVRTAYLIVLMTVHSFCTQYNTENSSDNLSSYLQTNIIAQMLSIGGEGIYTVFQKKWRQNSNHYN